MFSSGQPTSGMIMMMSYFAHPQRVSDLPELIIRVRTLIELKRVTVMGGANSWGGMSCVCPYKQHGDGGPETVQMKSNQIF